MRRTTAEIQNYGFERLERATSSKDSGISNMAEMEERLEGMTLTNSVRLIFFFFQTNESCVFEFNVRIIYLLHRGDLLPCHLQRNEENLFLTRR